MGNELISYTKFKELAFPSIVIILALNLGSIFDAFFVSSYLGENALAAVELFEPIVLIITILETLFGIGGKILTLNKKAVFDEKGSNTYFTLSILSTIIVSVIITALFILGKNYIIPLLYPPAEVLPYVEEYAVLLFLTVPVSAILGVLCEFVQIDGHENLSAYLMIIANVSIIILDYIFFDMLHTSIYAAALSTILGYSIGLVCYLKYHFDSTRTLHFIRPEGLSKAVKKSARIFKIGFPYASSYIFEIIMLYTINTLMALYLGNLGLVAFSICTFVYSLMFVIPIGLIMSMGSVVPVYYPQHDYKNINYLVRKATILSLAITSIFIVLIWTVPDLFLMAYGLDSYENADAIIHYMQLYSSVFIPEIIVEAAMTYYQAIKRTMLSTIISVLCMLAGPMLALVLFFPVIGINSVFICYCIGDLITIIFLIGYIKLNGRRNTEYTGILFFKKDLIQVSEDFILYSQNDKKDIKSYLKNLNADETCINDVESVIEHVFDKNSDVNVEILATDYDNYITLNFKFLGEYENLDNFKNEVSNFEMLKFSETLGINNLEYTINKI